VYVKKYLPNGIAKFTSHIRFRPAEEPHHLFDFLNTNEKNEDGLIVAFGGLLPET